MVQEMMVSSLMPPTLLSTNTGGSVMTTKPDITAGLPERDLSAKCPADGIRRDPFHLEASIGDLS
jgi:hypothetical protein